MFFYLILEDSVCVKIMTKNLIVIGLTDISGMVGAENVHHGAFLMNDTFSQKGSTYWHRQ